VISSSSFAGFIHDAGTVIFPGGMGTELQRRGYRSALPPWPAAANLDAPGLVEQIHADYIEAGADVAVTNTFRTTPRTFAKAGRDADAWTALRQAVTAALRAKWKAGRPVFVGGSFAPLEDCYRPDLVPSAGELREEHRQQAGRLADAGVDFLLPETIDAGLEGQIMAEAASATGLPFIVSFVVDSEANLLDGTPIAKALEKTDLPGRVGVSLNCRPVGTLDSAFQKLSSVFDGAIGLCPNGMGHANGDLGWCFEEGGDGIAKFTACAMRWKAAGATILGGCCGTTPAYIQALHRELRAAGKQRARTSLLRQLSSAAHLQDLA
jgi:S-methylmethionine-dependent homocysteine/selenocysteine methylase